MDVSVLLTGHSISVAFSLFLLRNWASYRETVAHFRSFEIFEVLFEVFARLLNLPEVSFTRPTPKILRLFTKSHFRSLFSKREEFPVFLWLCNGTPFVRQTSRTFFDSSISTCKTFKILQLWYGVSSTRWIWKRNTWIFENSFPRLPFQLLYKTASSTESYYSHCNCIIHLSVYTCRRWRDTGAFPLKPGLLFGFYHSRS